MARARNIKPGFFKDAKIVACSFPARLLFQGLWCMADYMGRLKYVPIEVKMELFPADDVDVPNLMEELRAQGLIEMYHDHSGAALVQVTNFLRHQNPHVNERQGRDKKPLPCLPGPSEFAGCDGEKKPPTKQEVEAALVVLREHSESNPADSGFLIPDSLVLPPEDSCAEPSDSPPEATPPEVIHDPTVITLPTNKHSTSGEEFPITESLITEWVEAFPAVDVPQQLRAIRSWLLSNQAKRKTKSGMKRFVNSWLSREQDRPSAGGSGRPPPGGAKTRSRSIQDDLMDTSWAGGIQ